MAILIRIAIQSKGEWSLGRARLSLMAILIGLLYSPRGSGAWDELGYP